MKSSVNAGQADRFVVNLDDSKISAGKLGKGLNKKPIDGLKEVIVVKNGKITEVWKE